MRGDVLDIVLVFAAICFAWSGYRQGFVVGISAFLGFVLGGLLGAQVAPSIAGRFTDADGPVVGLTVVLVLAIIGQLTGSLAGARLRARVVNRPVQAVDALGGAVVSVVSLLLVTWMLATAVASSPYPTLASQVRRSMVIAGVDAVIPDVARNGLQDFRDLIDEGGFPDVFGGLSPSDAASAAAPDSALTRSAVVQSVRTRVLKVRGVAQSCSRSIEGSGFVYAEDRVMTNAHVVAGVSRPTVEYGGDRLDATVVLFVPRRDIAVLHVPDLPRLTALRFAGAADPGDDAIVVGYPQDGPYRADAARVRETQRARGPDIYGDRTVVREIYALRGLVQPGNSGGPLLDEQGRVLGVVFAAAADRSDLGYALTAKEVASDAAAGRSATTRVSSGRCD